MTKYDIQRCLAIILAFTARVDGRYGPLQPAKSGRQVGGRPKNGGFVDRFVIVSVPKRAFLTTLLPNFQMNICVFKFYLNAIFITFPDLALADSGRRPGSYRQAVVGTG